MDREICTFGQFRLIEITTGDRIHYLIKCGGDTALMNIAYAKEQAQMLALAVGAWEKLLKMQASGVSE